MQSVNEIVEAIHKLPSGDQEKIRQTLEKEKRKKDEELKIELELFKQSEEWLKENREKYLKQWVCLEGDKLISHGADGREVYREAKKVGIKAPFIHYVEKEPEAFWGGWL